MSKPLPHQDATGEQIPLPRLTNEGVLCIPEPAAFAAFAQVAQPALVAHVGPLALFRVSGSPAHPHEPFYVLAGTDEPHALSVAVTTVLAAGALTVIHLGPAHAPTCAPGSLLIVEVALAQDGTAIPATPGMVRKLANRLGNHGLSGQVVQVSEGFAHPTIVSDRLTAPLMVAARACRRPTGALLVADPTWPWPEGTTPDPAPWAALYPVFAEILGRAAHYRAG